MADISCIKIADGTIYNIKDLEARKGLEDLLGKSYFANEEITTDINCNEVTEV